MSNNFVFFCVATAYWDQFYWFGIVLNKLSKQSENCVCDRKVPGSSLRVHRSRLEHLTLNCSLGALASAVHHFGYMCCDCSLARIGLNVEDSFCYEQNEQWWKRVLTWLHVWMLLEETRKLRVNLCIHLNFPHWKNQSREMAVLPTEPPIQQRTVNNK